MKPTLIFFILLISSSRLAHSQSIEKIDFDKNDKDAGYYLAVRPTNQSPKGVLVLFSSFVPPEAILTETKLHNTAYANGILTIVASLKQKITADAGSIARISTILNDVRERFAADKNRYALAGYDESGNIILRYTELAYEKPGQFPIQPKAVMTIDSPVDLFELWKWSENQVKKNFWPGAVGDAKYYLDEFTKSHGPINNNFATYNQLTPFNSAEEKEGNEKYLKSVALRLYYDMDIDWQLKNRRNSIYDTKWPAGSELIKRLLLRGNDGAEFIASTKKGFRSDGTRTPTSISIVDEVDCILWLNKALDIFNHNSWVPPYKLTMPANWGVERFELPPDFAKGFTYKGVEDIRFTPGWGDSTKQDYWSYAYLWWLEGEPTLDAATIQQNLVAYYSGLIGRNISARKIPENKQVPTTANIKKIKTGIADIETFGGEITMLDYMTQKPMLLNVVIHVKQCSYKGRSAVFVEVSPKPLSHPVWQQMDSIDRQIQCDGTAK